MTPLYFVSGLLIGIVATYMGLRIFGKQKIATAQQEAARIIEKSRNEAEVIVKRAEVDAKAEFIQRMDAPVRPASPALALFAITALPDNLSGATPAGALRASTACSAMRAAATSKTNML